MTYEIYISDSLHFLAEGKMASQRFVDIIRPRKIETRSAEEIAESVIKSAGLTLKGDDEE